MSRGKGRCRDCGMKTDERIAVAFTFPRARPDGGHPPMRETRAPVCKPCQKHYIITGSPVGKERVTS